MSFLPQILNHALGSNPPTATLHQSTAGSDWLWSVFSVILLSDLIAIFSSFRRPRNFIFHQLAIIILTTSAITYFSMASNLGHTPIVVEFDRDRTGTITRDVWYVRYIQWFINAPLLLLALFIGTGFPLGDTFTVLFMADAAVVLGLVGALVQSTYKWGYYTMGVFALIFIFWHLLFTTGGREFPTRTGRTRGPFIATAFILGFFWFIYPIVWGLCDGGNVISPTGEVIWYGILDILSGPVFLAFFLWSHSEVDLAGTDLSRRDVKA